MAGGKKDKRSVVKLLMTVSVVGAGLMFLWMLAAHPGISGLVSGEVFVKGLVFLVGLCVVPGLVLIVILLFSKGSGGHNFFWGEGRKTQAIQKSG